MVDLHPSRYDRQELLLLQQRALRDWRDSTWLAEHRPRDYVAVENFPSDEVWLDLGGGIGESQQTPGALVLGNTFGSVGGVGSKTGERRTPDLDWRGPEIPAGTADVDRVIVPEGTLRRFESGEIDVLLREIQRVLPAGGLLILREDVQALAKLKGQLADLGFEVEKQSLRRLDRDGEMTWRLTQKTARDEDQEPPGLRARVMGALTAQPIRSL